MVMEVVVLLQLLGMRKPLWIRVQIRLYLQTTHIVKIMHLLMQPLVISMLRREEKGDVGFILAFRIAV